MFLLPLSILAMVGFAVCAVMRHRAQPATGTASAPAATRPRAGFWPTTIEGKAGVGLQWVDHQPHSAGGHTRQRSRTRR